MAYSLQKLSLSKVTHMSGVPPIYLLFIPIIVLPSPQPSPYTQHMNRNTVEPPNNESIGTANFLEVFFIERYKSIEEYANSTLENFIMRGFSLLGEFIIRGSTVSGHTVT